MSVFYWVKIEVINIIMTTNCFLLREQFTVRAVKSNETQKGKQLDCKDKYILAWCENKEQRFRTYIKVLGNSDELSGLAKVSGVWV